MDFTLVVFRSWEYASGGLGKLRRELGKFFGMELFLLCSFLKEPHSDLTPLFKEPPELGVPSLGVELKGWNPFNLTMQGGSLNLSCK